MNLRGENIYLRAPEPEDIDLLYRWENDPDNWRVSEITSPVSRDMIQRYVRSTHDIYTNKQLRLIICLLEDGRQVGSVDLFDYDPDNRRAGVGILIADLKDRGMGHASEALDVLIAYAFSTLGLHQLFCNVLPSNPKSQRLFEQKGFRVTGTKKEWLRKGSEHEWEDQFFMQLIPSSKSAMQ